MFHIFFGLGERFAQFQFIQQTKGEMLLFVFRQFCRFIKCFF